MITPRIEASSERLVVAKSMAMSRTDYRIAELWRSFMPHRKEVRNTLSADLLSVAVYPSGYFAQFNPATPFVRYAGVEVSLVEDIPDGMELLRIPQGLYAVFEYRGLNTDPSIFRYIYGEWLPQSDYRVDERPHFEVLGANYRNNDPESEEELWIPIALKRSTPKR